MLHKTGILKQGEQPTGELIDPHTASQEESSGSWLKEYGKHAPIAIVAALAILAHLLLRYLWRVGHLDLLPLYLALLAGGIPLLLGLARQAFRLEVGAD